jgi:hypothetical protein
MYDLMEANIILLTWEKFRIITISVFLLIICLRLATPDAKSFVVYVLQVNNAFNMKQVYGYEYSYNGLRKEQIVPPSRMFVYIGAFFSFGIDRTENAVNDRLF